MKTPELPEIRRVLIHARGCVPLLTSRFDSKRGGLIATSVEVCGREPPLVCIAVAKGHNVDLLMRDSQSFGVCFIPGTDRLLVRRFSKPVPPDSPVDPFADIELDRMVSGAPIVRRAAAALDCQIFRLVDLETDHELIIGRVVGARVNGGG